MVNTSKNLSEARKIKEASLHDIPAILAILNENLIVNKQNLAQELLEQNGFLIQAFTEEEARNAILDKKNCVVLVANENEEIVGYIMGTNIKTITALQMKLSQVSEELNKIIAHQKTFYHRHIAKKLNKKKIGRNLLQALIEKLKNKGYQNIICQIAEAPVKNKVSIYLHEQFGFSCCGFTQLEDKTFGVYLKKL